MNNILRITALGLILFSNLVFASCQKKIFKKTMDKKNPVEYNFSISKDSLQSIISAQLKVENMMLWDSQHGIMVLEEISKKFSQKGNVSDFCLMPIYFIGKSKIYFAEENHSLDYEAWFYLHLESIDETHTKLTITTFEPMLIVGRDLLPSPPHFGRGYKKMTVEPSTIEEYEILQKIGNLIGEKDMPPLILPNEKNNEEIVKH
jgi:hypothetical protein